MSVHQLETENFYNINTGTILINSTRDTTSSTTGALIIEGGAVVKKHLRVIGGIIADGSSYDSTADSTSISTGSLVVSGGAGIAKNVYIGQDLHVAGDIFATQIHYESEDVITSSEESTSTSTGAMIVAGGVGIGKNTNVGGVLKCWDVSASTSASTGSIIASGGLGVAGRLNVGGATALAGITTVSITTQSDNTSNGALVVSGGASVAKNLRVGGTIYGNIEGSISFTTLESTSTSTGGLICGGGAGIAKNLFVGGVANIVNNTGSTSASTGSVLVSGGLGVVQNINAGGNLGVLGSTTLRSVAVTNATDSSDMGTGAGIITGGLGVGKNLHCGGSYIHNQSTPTNSGSIVIDGVGVMGIENGGRGMKINEQISSTAGAHFTTLVVTPLAFISSITGSTSTGTGAITVAGGAGIAQNLYVGGTTNITGALTGTTANLTTTTQSTSTSTGSLTVAGGLGLAKNLYVGGTTNITGALTGTTANLTTTTQSTSTSTGSLTVAGGLGLAKNLYVGGTTNITGALTGTTANLTTTTQATSTSTGVLTVSGGAGIAKSLFVGDMVYAQNNVVANTPHGFENQTDSVMTYNSTTNVFSIAPTGASFNVWVNGKKYNYTTAQTLVHTASIGVYHYYFGTSGLAVSATVPNYSTYATCANVYFYNASSYFIMEERHDCIMDSLTHKELHDKIGGYVLDGGCVLGGYNLSPSVPANSDNQVTLTSGVYSDEGLNTAITAISAGSYKISYLTGASDNWIYKTLTVPLSYTTTGYVEYNYFTGGNWTLTALGNNEYVNYYVIVVPSLTSGTQVFCKAGQAKYTTLADATNESPLSLTFSQYAPPEYSIRYKITYRTSNTYSTLGKCRIEAVQEIDLSNSMLVSTSTINNHNALLGLQLADTAVTWGHINDSAQSLYGIKTMQNTTDATSISTGGMIVKGGLGVAKQLHTGSTISIHNITDVSKISTLNTDTSGIMSITASQIKCISTLDSTSITTGSTLVSGGLGVAKQIHLGDALTIHNITDTTKTCAFTCDTSGILTVNSSGNIIKLDATDQVQILSTTDGTSTTTGALIVNGGVSILKTTDIYSTVASTSTSTGAMTVAGGVGIGKTLFVGDGTTGSTSASTGAIVVNGGIGATMSITTGAQINSANSRVDDSVSTATLKAEGYTRLNADYTAGTGGLTATTSGTVAISSGKISIGTGSYIMYPSDSSVDAGTVGAFRLKFTPSYSGTPSASTCIFTTYPPSSSNNNVIKLIHAISTGRLYLLIRSTVSTPVVDRVFTNTAWSPIANTEYEIELNFDFGNAQPLGGAHRLFIDGVQWGVTLTNDGAGTRVAHTNIGVGDSVGLAFNVRDICFFKTVQHTASYKAGYSCMPIANAPYVRALSGIDATSKINGAIVSNGGISAQKDILSGSRVVSSSSRIEETTDTSTAKLKVEGYKSLNADYTAGTGGLTCTTSGTVAISNGKIALSANSSVTYPIDSSVDAGTVGAIRFKYTPSYSGIPASSTVIMGNSTGYTANNIYLSHVLTTGQLSCYIRSSNPAVVFWINTAIGQWFPVANQEYEFEFDWDIGDGNVGSGAYRLFIDGIQITSAVNGAGSTGTRGANTTLTFGVTNLAFKIRDICMFATVQHTTNYDIGYAVHPAITAPYVRASTQLEIHNSTDWSKNAIMAVDSNGDMSVDCSGNDLNFANTDIIHVLATTASSSTSTGALQVLGGVAVAGNLNVGGSINYASYSVTGTNDSTSVTTGSAVIAGGVGIGKSLHVAREYCDSTINDSQVSFVSEGQFYVNALYNSGTGGLTATTTGTVAIVNEKIQINANATLRYSASTGQTGAVRMKYTPLYTGQPPSLMVTIVNLYTSGNQNYLELMHKSTGDMWLTIYDNSSNVVFNNALATWSGTNGTEYEFELNWDINASTTACRLFINGTQLGSTVSATNNVARGTTTYLRLGYVGTADCAMRDIVVYSSPQHTANYTAGYYSTARMLTNLMSVKSTIDSASTSTGALVVSGGVGISKSLNIGDTLYAGGNTVLAGGLVITLTNASTSPSSGSLVVAGGCGVAGDLYVGGTINGGGFVPTTLTSIIAFTGPCDLNVAGKYYKTGYQCFLAVNYGSAVSTTAGHFEADLPSGFSPPNQIYIPIIVTDNGTMTNGMVTLLNSGKIRVYVGVFQNFTGSGNAGFGFHITYNIL